MNQPQRLWTKDFILVSAMNFLLTLVFYLLIVIMGGYAIEVFHASTSQAGLVSSIFMVGALIGRLFMGRYIEKIGYRKLLFVGLILYMLTSGLYFIQTGIGFLLITRVIHGVMLGVTLMVVTASIAHIIPPSRRGEGIGYFSLSTILATAIGPFLGILLVQHASYNVIFAGCVGLGVISLIVALMVNIPNPVHTDAPPEKMSLSLKSFIEPRALPISIVILVLAFCYSSVLTYMNFYANELDLAKVASFFFIAYSIAILISRPFSGKLLDKKGANYVMYPATVIFALGMLVLSTAHSGFTFLLASVLIGFGYGNIQSCCQAVAIKSVPPEKIGLSTSTFSIFLDLGLGFGPYLLGAVIAILSYSQLYAVLAVVILLSIVLYTFLYARPNKNKKQPVA
ncbi:MFS transporter [Lysinibacillus sp. 2017]|uniref:MFS transporter n=1 Tax=unclassified Lysinibacillus TaxID=2636778 RepID=UPI000D527ABB|nr:MULTISPECIES: MFS transporter [unclassified Lysinibacillus]AWE07225.1 MFS transporter [Lysinibacillus sp. 2017]TGN34682.1 MFS transporter [Lysinibacillus sp. S2017]